MSFGWKVSALRSHPVRRFP